MATIPIISPDGETVGAIYRYCRRYYHATSTGGMHGPWDSAQTALREWCQHCRRDTQYFRLGKPTTAIPQTTRKMLSSQRSRYYASA